MGDPFEKSSDKHLLDQMRRDSAERELRGAIERIIDEAQKSGVFDDLPGKGKPLQLGKNRQAGDRALAFDLLQNNDYTLPWIAARQEMLLKIAALRDDLASSWQAFQQRLAAAPTVAERQTVRAQWQEEKTKFSARVREVNQGISALNLTIPAEPLELLKLQWEKELARAGVTE
jgi:hypothetical protein